MPVILRLPGVKRVRSKGRLYHYHRKTGKRLPGAPGSAEFMARLADLDARSSADLPKTFGALVAAYRQSPEWQQLAPASRRVYERVFARLRPNEPVPLAAIDSAMLYDLRDKIAGERSWSFANRVIVTLRLLFTWGLKRGHCPAGNPAAHVDLVRRPRGLPDRNRPWTPAELDQVLHAVPDWLRVAVAIAAYTGLRESDVATVTWAAYDGATFRTRSQKTSVQTVIPVHRRLKAVLDAAPRRAVTIVTNAAGQPMTAGTLGAAFFRYVPRSRGLTFHGLRHTLGTALAEAGADAATIAAVLGHETLKMAQHYSRHADRTQLAEAAIERLENGKGKTIRKTGD